MKIVKLREGATVPTYGTPGAACFDLYACIDGVVVIDYSGEIIPTGLAFEVPEGFVMQIYSRSGHGFKDGVSLANCVGIIDSDYRGEVQVKLVVQTSHSLKIIKHGDRIAQAMLVPVSQVKFDVVGELSTTERGDGGFGSTGI